MFSFANWYLFPVFFSLEAGNLKNQMIEKLLKMQFIIARKRNPK